MFIRNIRIKGGIHNDTYAKHMTQMSEKEVEELTYALVATLEKYTGARCPGWIEITFTKAIGGKTHS